MADVLEVNIWKSLPGKGPITMQNGQEARAIHEKLGATVTIGQDMMGRMHYAVAFKTWTEWVQFGNKLQVSEEWQTGDAELIEDIVQTYGNYAYDTHVLVASIRNVQQVHEAGLVGADVSTIPPKVLDQMVRHDLTDKGLDAHLADWSAHTAS